MSPEWKTVLYTVDKGLWSWNILQFSSYWFCYVYICSQSVRLTYSSCIIWPSHVVVLHGPYPLPLPWWCCTDSSWVTLYEDSALDVVCTALRPSPSHAGVQFTSCSAMSTSPEQVHGYMWGSVAAGAHSRARCGGSAAQLPLCPREAPGSAGCGLEDTRPPHRGW